MQLKVFYSWQSDLPNSTNRRVIQDALEAVAKEIRNDQVAIEPVIDRDTAGVAGSPDIGHTIFQKIDDAAVFVGDVSIINRGSRSTRPVPNPNVLLELGYALRGLGGNRVLMVMNTAYGTPDKLPFDLKQKRVVTYELKEGIEDSKAIKGELRARLKVALETILSSHVRLLKATADAAVPLAFDEAMASVSHGRRDETRAVKTYCDWLISQFKGLDNHSEEGESDDLLVAAIERTIPLMKGFSDICDTIAASGSDQALETLRGFFEALLALHDLPADFAGGSYYQTDFDFFKFVSNEAFLICTAAVLRARRWTLLDALVGRQYFAAGRNGGKLVGFARFTNHLEMLDKIRTHRLATGGTRRISIHADILKERHSKGPLSTIVNWQSLREADLLLFLRSYLQTDDRFDYWFPRTSVYLSQFESRLLLESQTAHGADSLRSALGASTETTGLKQKLSEALRYLNQALISQDIYSGGVQFDVSKSVI
jgi:hypothetical protein